MAASCVFNEKQQWSCCFASEIKNILQKTPQKLFPSLKITMVSIFY